MRFKNGLRLLLVPDSTAVAVEVATWFAAPAAGGRAEPAGLARMLEHLGFRSVTGRVAAEGGTAGSFSTADVTCFYETLPPGGIEAGLDLEAERMKTLGVAPADLEAERARAQAQARDHEAGGPAARGLRRLYGILFPEKPYRLAPEGTEESLSRITASDCQQAFRARFGPERALVTVVGRFDPEPALSAARARLEAIPARGRAAEMGRSAMKPSGAPARGRRVTESYEQDLRLLILGWSASAAGDSDAVALDLLGRALGAGSGSKLEQEAVGPGAGLLFAQGGYDGQRDAGVFYVMGGIRPDADSAAIERDMVGRVEKLASEPVSAEEVERARRQAESAILFGWQAVHGRTLALGAAELVEGDHRAAWSRLERLRRIGPSDLQRAAARVLKSENRAAVWLVPAGAGSAGVPAGGAAKR